MDRENKQIAAWTCCAIATLIPVAARQLDLVAHLPDPPSKVFASDEITSSSMAHPFGVPDSIPGLCSYAGTLALALGTSRYPSLRRLLALKLAADGSFAAINTVRQIRRFGKLCSWCMGTAFCTAGMLVAGRRLLRYR